METIDQNIEELIEAEDYLSAYLSVREDDELKKSYTGKIVNAVIAELSAQPSRGNQERVYYLRSLLLWIFRDVPGLAPIYRSQLREGMLADSSPDLLKLFFNMGNNATRGFPKTPEEAAENVKQTMDDVVDDIKTGNADQRMKDFFDFAEEGLKSGLKGVSDLFDSFASSSSGKPTEQTRDAGKTENGSGAADTNPSSGSENTQRQEREVPPEN